MSRKLYFVGPFVDIAAMGGLSLLAFVYFATFGRGSYPAQVSAGALGVAAFTNWVVNFPHFAATNYRLYQSRANMRQFRLTALLVPVLLTLAVVACFSWPREFAPTWAKLLLIWSAYHYAGQNLGLSLIYARRAGVDFSPRSRFALAGFLYAAFLAQYAQLEAVGREATLFHLSFPLLELPGWLAPAFRGVALCFAAFALGEAAMWMRRKKRVVPLIVFLPALTHFTWTLLGADTYSFQVLVPFFHGLQYLLVAWAVEMGSGESSSRPSLPWFRSARWALIIVAGGALLFWLLPRAVAALGYDLMFCTAIFFVTVQVHHFFVDGVIWKLRGLENESPLFRNFRGDVD